MCKLKYVCSIYITFNVYVLYTCSIFCHNINVCIYVLWVYDLLDVIQKALKFETMIIDIANIRLSVLTEQRMNVNTIICMWYFPCPAVLPEFGPEFQSTSLTYTPQRNLAAGDKVVFACRGDVGNNPVGSLAWYWFMAGQNTARPLTGVVYYL